MAKRSIQFIQPQRSRQLTDLADRAKISLSRYAGIDVDYDAIGLQMLDEWIERHLQQFPNPSAEILLVWGAFLGEAFRHRHEGQWGIDSTGPHNRVGVICPREGRSPLFADVMDQVGRRIREGMNESLAFYYTIKGIEITSH
ncbi:MAG: DUF3806 domain-containing protein [Anaerolineae bacterium]|jgi:hypothetical protein|nr:DUF3806 domain-containing protein [Anaerolineae bacterium]